MTPDEKNSHEPEDSRPYETPAIEEVVTPATIEREVHYAGIQVPSNIAN